MTISFGIVGTGYWGPNLARNLGSVEGGVLAWICDLEVPALARMSSLYPKASTTCDLKELIEASNVDAVAIATPARTHYDIAKRCLQAGKHVLVEKPLAMSSTECDELISLAQGRDLRLMVGHTFLYSPPVLHIKELLDSGAIGDLYYAYSTRVNLGQVRRDVNAMWNLAPHDISIFQYLFDMTPLTVSARGVIHIQESIEDVVFMDVNFPGNIVAHIHVSWLDPSKVRKLTIVGSKKMVIYDDVSPDAQVQILDKGVDKVSRHDPETFGSFSEFQLLLRKGDVHTPKIPASEPLQLECQHFADCIRNGAQPRTDGEHGKQVVQILEAAQRSLEEQGRPVEVSR